MSVVDAHRIASAFNVRFDLSALLYDPTGDLVADVTEHLIPRGSRIEQELTRRIPGSARLQWGIRLPAGAYRIQLSMTVTDIIGGDTATVDLGRWVMETPTHEAGSDPPVWNTDCYDPVMTLDNQIPRRKRPNNPR